MREQTGQPRFSDFLEITFHPMYLHLTCLIAVAVASCRSDGAGMATYDGRGVNRTSLQARDDIEGLEVRRDERAFDGEYIAIPTMSTFHGGL